MATTLQRLGHRLSAYVLPAPPWQNVATTFVVSTGRTGTTFLAEGLARLPQTLAMHEPDPDFLRLGVRYAHGAVSDVGAIRRIKRGRRRQRRHLSRVGATRYVECNNRLFSLVAPLREHFGPQVKFVHIARDGRDIVRSGMSRGWFRPGERQPRLRAEQFPDDPWAAAWRDLSQFEKVCWLWQKKDGMLTQALQQLPPQQVLWLRFDRLFGPEQVEALAGLARFCGSEDHAAAHWAQDAAMTAAPVNATVQHTFPHWRDWASLQQTQFERIAGTHQQMLFPDAAW